MREDLGGHVAHERDGARLGHIRPGGAVDRVVRAVMEVCGGGIGRQLRLRWDARVPFPIRVRRDAHRAVLCRLLRRAAGEMTGDGVVRAAAGRQQVQRHHRKLRRRAALQEEHLVRFRHAERGAEARLRLVEDRGKLRTAMAHLHDGHAGAAAVHELRLRLAQHALRQHRRPGGEIEDLFSGHGVFPFTAVNGFELFRI